MGRAGREVWGKSKEGRGRRGGVGEHGKDRSGGRVRGGVEDSLAGRSPSEAGRGCPLTVIVPSFAPSLQADRPPPGPSPTPPIPGRKLEKSDGPDICSREGHTLTAQRTQEVTCVLDYTSLGYINTVYNFPVTGDDPSLGQNV